MKRVMSVSLGSSKRDDGGEICLAGEVCRLERIGTDGDKAKMLDLFARYRGAVDAFGLGGTDLYLYAGGRRYTFRESLAFVRAAAPTPVFDGSGLKATLERRVLRELAERRLFAPGRDKVLLVCGMDRFGMAESFWRLGCDLVCGDLMFGLSLPVPIRSPQGLSRLARLLAPVVTRLPIRWLYPVGRAQEVRRPRFAAAFAAADVIAGDFHFIRRCMPDRLPDKLVITNTVTADDRALLRDAGARLLVTTTPTCGGRSFGTNLLEAAVCAVSGGSAAAAEKGLEGLGLRPGIFFLQDE